MSVYDLQHIIKLWERDKLTTEQAVGQIILHLQSLSKRVNALEKQAEKSRRLQSK